MDREELKLIKRYMSCVDSAWKGPFTWDDKRPIKTGDVIRLQIHGSVEAVDVNCSVVYQVTGRRNQSDASDLALKQLACRTVPTDLAIAAELWQDGHCWNFGAEVKTYSYWIFNEGSGAQSGCVCMRCRSRNQFAEPNRPDGKYVCYECR